MLSFVRLKWMIQAFMLAICYFILVIYSSLGPISLRSYLILQSSTNLNFYNSWTFFLSSLIRVFLSRIVFYLYYSSLACDCFFCKFSSCFCFILSISYRVCFKRCLCYSKRRYCLSSMFFLVLFSVSALVFCYWRPFITVSLSYLRILIYFSASFSTLLCYY